MFLLLVVLPQSLRYCEVATAGDPVVVARLVVAVIVVQQQLPQPQQQEEQEEQEQQEQQEQQQEQQEQQEQMNGFDAINANNSQYPLVCTVPLSCDDARLQLGH